MIEQPEMPAGELLMKKRFSDGTTRTTGQNVAVKLLSPVMATWQGLAELLHAPDQLMNQ